MKKKKSIDLYEQKAISSKGIVFKYFKMLFKIKFPWHLYALTLLTSYLYTKVYLLVPKKQMAIAGGDFSSNAIMLVVLALLFKCLSRCLDDLTSTFFEKTTTRNAQKSLWKRILKFNASKFDDMQPRELITRLTTDTSNVRMLPNLVKNVIMSCLASFSIIKFLGTYDSRLVIVILCMIPLMVIVQLLETIVMFKLEAKTTYKLAVAARYIADSLTNMPIYKIFCKEDKATKAGDKYINDMFKINVTKGVTKKSFYYAQELVIVIAKVVTVVYGSTLMFKGDITFAVWYAFYMYSQQFIRAITGVFGSIIGIRTSAGSVARVIRLFDEELEDESGENKFSIEDISFKNVSFAYNEGDEVLKNVSFKIKKGKKVAIVGLSGSGKSTLVSLITRLYKPNTGVITNGDQDIKSYAVNTWRSKIGLVSQDTMLYSGTVYENITYGLDRKVSDEEIKEVIKKVNLDKTFEELSNGYDTNIGELGSFFSGGEKQRLAVARVLLRKPEVIILDEACSALDMENDKLINELIVKECENVTIINVTHRLSNIDNYEKIMIINKGKIEGIGTHKYLLENNKNYQSMYEVEIKKKINI